MTFDAYDWARRWSPGSGPTKGGDVAAMYIEGAERWDVSIDLRTDTKQGIVAFADGFLTAVPDAVATVRGVVQTESTCVIEWTWTGTHLADMEGWPARGEPINLNGVNIIALDGDQISGETSYWDAKTIFGG